MSRGVFRTPPKRRNDVNVEEYVNTRACGEKMKKPQLVPFSRTLILISDILFFFNIRGCVSDIATVSSTESRISSGSHYDIIRARRAH